MLHSKNISRSMLERLARCEQDGPQKDAAAGRILNSTAPLRINETGPFVRLDGLRKRQILERMLMD